MPSFSIERSLTNSQLAEEFFNEWKLVEEFRIDRCKELMLICRAMNEVRGKLNENMMQLLVEDKWREGQVTRALSDATVGLMQAVRALEKPTTLESVLTGPSWPEEQEDGVL